MVPSQKSRLYIFLIESCKRSVPQLFDPLCKFYLLWSIIIHPVFSRHTVQRYLAFGYSTDIAKMCFQFIHVGRESPAMRKSILFWFKEQGCQSQSAAIAANTIASGKSPASSSSALRANSLTHSDIATPMDCFAAFADDIGEVRSLRLRRDVLCTHTHATIILIFIDCPTV